MGENAPPPEGWSPPPPKCCPFPECGICMTATEAIWAHGVDEHIIRGTE